VCNYSVRKICKTLKYPELPYLTDVTGTVLFHCKDRCMYLTQYISPVEHVFMFYTFQNYFCTSCGGYIVHTRMAPEEYLKTFECRCKFPEYNSNSHSDFTSKISSFLRNCPRFSQARSLLMIMGQMRGCTFVMTIRSSASTSRIMPISAFLSACLITFSSVLGSARFLRAGGSQSQRAPVQLRYGALV
jgi:hypothetical protein